MQHEFNAPDNAAKSGCYNCLNNHDVVILDSYIEGEGTLVLCTGCILEAASVARIGRARIKLAEKRARQAVAQT